MKAPHVLHVKLPSESFAALFKEGREHGLVGGWLDLETAWSPPEGLLVATQAGALRAVSVGPQGSVAVKHRRGPAVFADLLREHFLGARFVLVAGGTPGIELRPEAGFFGPRQEAFGWVVGSQGVETRYTTSELVKAFRRVRPFGV